MRVAKVVVPVAAALAVAAGIAGCGSESDSALRARKLPPTVRADADSVVAANTRFALDLYRAIRSEDADANANLIVSPFSVSTAFAMVYAGAREQTAAEMARVFHFSLEPDRLHPAFGALLRSLEAGAEFGGYRLDLANRLWGQTGFPLLPAYVRLTSENYEAELSQLDFADSEAARRVINDWVTEETAGKIQDLIPPGMIGPLTRLVLTDAVYFKGRWLRRFDPDATRDRPFHLDAVHTVSVPTMSRTGSCLLGRAEGVRVLELPYETEDLSMVFLVPEAAEGLGDLEDRLTPETLHDWVDSVHETKAGLEVPRFRVESTVMLKDLLSGLGMPLAFTTGRADFAGIDGKKDLWIKEAVHKGYVEVNEEGTEAAGATAVAKETLSTVLSFRINRPFLFLIRDRMTGSLLFLGRVTDPSA